MTKLYALTLLLFLISSSLTAQSIEQIRTVSHHFLTTLTDDQLATVNHAFDDSSRTQWTNLPVGLATRPGLRYGALSEDSRIEFHHLLTTLFSSQGYLKTTSILQLDDILNVVYETAYKRGDIPDQAIEQIRNLDWSLENYYISFYGEPGPVEPWGIKFEGHHISYNLTATGDDFSMTPLFLGSDPAEVKISKYAGIRVLSKEEDYGIKLINALDDEQKSNATLSQDVPGDILTNPSSTQRLLEYQGIKASELTDTQKKLLKRLISEYIGNLEHEKYQYYLEKIDSSGIDEIYFAWIGSYQRMNPHYYAINGPDFLIEYDNVGFNNDGNHIHTIWREKGNDFGADLLREHRVNHQH
ncbi:DUF3500 domain-containing protein [Rhodohalobacter sulfatireducens]|uniref:DUF3500 domain-containing protein n=1 Tax=Rhodohalobacter sulfatireducens TaxID=2911366 RepID=A0ABS9KF98_9BACT|nr:DUF3500 domain-containing protein [Rhodohalobacter sulfatireducens]MCG2589505.1 DUF3500 domain-containing protein [Rhodohalobacter sulfatireducens]